MAMATRAWQLAAPPCANCGSLIASATGSSRALLPSLKSSGRHGFSQFTRRPQSVANGRRFTSGQISAISVTERAMELENLPSWAEFELGRSCVFWETETGEPPEAGLGLTIYFNPKGSELQAQTEYGIGFNGGFNQPIMCGGEPRIMTLKKRGAADPDLYSIKINVPEHALNLQFSFTDGTNWDGTYIVKFVPPAKWRNKPVSFFNEGLAATLSADGACAQAIFPEPVFVQDRCSFPANLAIEGGNRCELDLVPGCTDRENPFYDPLANVEDGSCPYISDSDTES